MFSTVLKRRENYQFVGNLKVSNFMQSITKLLQTEQVRIVGVSVHGTNGGRWTQTDVDVSRNSNLVRKGMLSCSDERSGSGNSQPSTSSQTAQVPVRAVRKETESSNQVWKLYISINFCLLVYN